MFLCSLVLATTLAISDLHEQYSDIEIRSEKIQLQIEKVFTQTEMNALAKKKRDLWYSEVLVLINYISEYDKSVIKAHEVWEKNTKEKIVESLKMYSGSIYECMYYMEEANAYEDRAITLLELIARKKYK